MGLGDCITTVGISGLPRKSHLFFTTDFPSAPFSLPLATHPFSLPLATHPFCNVTTLRVYLVGVATVGRLCHGLHIFIAANRTPEREPLSNRFRWYLTSWRPMGCSVDVWWAREGELGGKSSVWREDSGVLSCLSL